MSMYMHMHMSMSMYMYMYAYVYVYVHVYVYVYVNIYIFSCLVDVKRSFFHHLNRSSIDVNPATLKAGRNPSINRLFFGDDIPIPLRFIVHPNGVFPHLLYIPLSQSVHRSS
jgi:hypothetical protein